jgi:hypothetical protein
VLCSCSSGTSAAPSKPVSARTTAPAATSSTAVSTTVVVTPAKADQLTALVLQPADLPAGWTGTRYQPDPTSAANNAAFASCLGVRNTSLDQVADVHSPDFSLRSATISSEAASYRSKGDLTSDVAALTSARYPSCLESGLRAALAKTLPAGAAIKSVAVKATPGPGGGPSNVVGTAAAAVTITNAGLTLTIYSSTVFVVGPLIEAQLVFTNVGQAATADLQATLVKAVASRAARG